MELKDLAEKLNTASTEIKNAQDKLTAEIKAAGTESAETKAALVKAQSSFEELKGYFEKMDAKLVALEEKAQRPGFGQIEKAHSLGELFIKSDIGQSLSNGQGLNRSFAIERKAITGLAASAGALVDAFRDTRVFQNPNRQVRIRDLIPSVPASSNAIEVMRENVFTNNAAPQGTGGALGSGEFIAKAESNLTYSLLTYNVRTIAHWIPASKQILNDAPMLENLINNRLTYGLDLVSDAQLLLGDGTGQNLTGLLVDAGVSTVGQITAAEVTAAGSLPAAMIDHIRSAITVCQTFEYYNITGLVMNPNDFEKLETAKATDGHYILVPFAATNAQTQQIWRVPVIVTNAMPVNQFLLGDWTMGATIYDAESVSVQVATQHADFFVKNGVVILAEERYTLAIPLPKAFCKGLFTVAS